MTGPTVVIGALTFNGGDRDFRCTSLDGWYGTSAPRSELLPSGTAAGAVAVGPWDDAEAYYTLNGVIRADDRATLMTRRRQLVTSTPATYDWPLLVQGNGEDVDLTVYVRRYDREDIGLVGQRNLTFTIPLVATDPLKYGASLHNGAPFGVFTGQSWFDVFDVDTAPTPDLYYMAPDSPTTAPALLFERAEAASGLPLAQVLTSPGDQASRRLTVEVTGPVNQGDWFVVNEATGDEMWADLSLVAGQTVVFDCYNQTLTLNGSPIDELMFGDFLTLEPGDNTFRLVAGSLTDGFATISRAEPAYS